MNTQSRTHQPDPDDVMVRDVTDTSDADGLFRIRMPVTSTAEARDGVAFDREKVEGFGEQIEGERIPVFLDHGRNETTGHRYSALGKVGYLDNPDVREREDIADLMADFVLADPDEVGADAGTLREALETVRTQAALGIPLASSIGWSEDTGERELPGDADLLEASIVGIPSDARTTTDQASAEPALARAVATASEDFDVETFVDALRSETDDTRQLPDAVVDELGGRLAPNAGTVEAAQQALDWAEEYPEEFALGSDDGEGLRRARQLVDHADEPLDGENEDGVDYWTEIEAFHSRHHAQGNHELDDDFESEPWRDAGYVAHLAWGGDAGFEQAQEVVAALEALADDDDVDYDRDAITAEVVKGATPIAVDGDGTNRDETMTEETTDESGEEPDDTNADESDGVDAQEFRESMLEMQREQTEILQTLATDMDGDDEDDDDEDDMEESAADTDDDTESEHDADADETETRTVTLDGEDMAVDEARERLADLRDEAADTDAADLDPKTQDRVADAEADDNADSEERSADSPDWWA